jgi:hydrogenase expression/formation protein HypC
VTAVCLGIPGQVLEFMTEHPDLARVDVSGVRRVINVGLLEEDNLQIGDWILIHVGFALSKIDETEAQAALQFLEDIGDAYADELMALQSSAILDEPQQEEVPDAVRG